MKFNWGVGITLAISFFLILILSLVLRANRETIDLVTEDYYAKEIQYQQEIEKLRNSANLENGIQVKQTDEFIFILFPTDFLADSVKGEIHLYRASDKSKDRTYTIKLDSIHQCQISKAEVITGKYDLSVDWKYFDTPYLHKEMVLFY